VTRRLAAAAWRTTLSRHLILAVAGVLVVVLVLESVDDFRAVQLTQMAYLGTATGGLTVLTGLNGQISLGHGALMAVGAYTTALLLPPDGAKLPLPLVVVVATAVTLALGAVVGAAAARLRGPYLAGATLALAVALPGVALQFDHRLGGEQGLLVHVPDAPDWVLNSTFFVTGQDLTPSKYLAYLAWAILLVSYLLLANLSRSRVGRQWRAVRDDEVAAELAGIHLGRARVSAFVASAGAAGAAGSVLAMAVRLTAPTAFTLELSLTLLTAVVLGGLGSLTGALLGAAMLTFLPSVITNAGTSACSPPPAWSAACAPRSRGSAAGRHHPRTPHRHVMAPIETDRPSPPPRWENTHENWAPEAGRLERHPRRHPAGCRLRHRPHRPQEDQWW
jgi:branched-chain amino acid transport system permease protein